MKLKFYEFFVVRKNLKQMKKSSFFSKGRYEDRDVLKEHILKRAAGGGGEGVL